jgi:hypothetical protein
MRHMCMHKNHGSDQISHPFNHRGIYIYTYNPKWISYWKAQ